MEQLRHCESCGDSFPPSLSVGYCGVKARLRRLLVRIPSFLAGQLVMESLLVRHQLDPVGFNMLLHVVALDKPPG